MEPTIQTKKVLVTGATGYVAFFIIIKLLKEGYKVRTTIRKLTSKDEILRSLKEAGIKFEESDIEFYQTDLTSDEGWKEAVNGVEYVFHVASPVPIKQPENEDDIIIPAREGTLRVIKAAADDGNVRRVIFTSTFATIGYGKGSENLGRPLNENDWTIIDSSVSLYAKSKVLAEKAAWEFIEKHSNNGGKLELVVINPTAVIGPNYNDHPSASIEIIRSIIKGSPYFLTQNFGLVDVRDLADLHYLAMINQNAKGQRFLAVSDDKFTTMALIANYIKDNFSDNITQNIKKTENINPDNFKSATNEKSKKLLNWNPRSSFDSIKDTIDSLLKYKLI